MSGEERLAAVVGELTFLRKITQRSIDELVEVAPEPDVYVTMLRGYELASMRRELAHLDGLLEIAEAKS